MLSSAQIKHAMSAKTIQTVWLSFEQLTLKVCHIDNSVFVIFFDGEKAIESISYVIGYDILALINSVDWPVHSPGERNGLAAFDGKTFIVKVPSERILGSDSKWKTTSTARQGSVFSDFLSIIP